MIECRIREASHDIGTVNVLIAGRYGCRQEHVDK